MQIIRHLNLRHKKSPPLVLAIGFFDGMHCGHQRVISRAMGQARKMGGTTWVLTFSTHPARIIHPQAVPSLLTSTRHKLQLLQALGITGCIVLNFTHALSQMEPHQFVDKLLKAIPALKHIVVGQNWTFGRGGRGTAQLLKALMRPHGVNISIVLPFLWKNRPVSSTRIRRAIIAGKLGEAELMLGRPYSILGTVLRGRKIGRTLGVPTANLDPHNEVLPPDGVYAANAIVKGKLCPGVANLGLRPTICPRHTKKRVLELHLFDWHSALYGKEIAVMFVKKIRNEQCFASRETLRRQIVRDIAKARNYLAHTASPISALGLIKLIRQNTAIRAKL